MIKRYFKFRMTERLHCLVYVHSSLSVCGLGDNRSAVVCVLRSLADLCSVLPVCSGLATSQSPNILYPNHTFSMSHSDKTLSILLLSLPFIYLYIRSHCFSFPSLDSSQRHVCIIMFTYIPPRI